MSPVGIQPRRPSASSMSEKPETLVQDEQGFGRLGGWRAGHGGHGPHHDGGVMAFGIDLLTTGEAPGRKCEEERRKPHEEAGPAGAGRRPEEEQEDESKGKSPEDQRQNGPGVGGEQIAHLPDPGLQDEFRDLVDTVLGLVPRKFQIVADVGVGRVQTQGALVVEDGRGDLARLEIGVPQVEIQFLGGKAGRGDAVPVVQRLVPVAGGIDLHTGLPEGIGIAFGRLRSQREQQQEG